MANVGEVQEALDIAAGGWATYIADGVITKRKRGEYDVGTVAKEIIRWQKSRMRKSTSEKSNLVLKVQRLEKKLTIQETVTGDQGLPLNSHDKQVKALDLKLKEAKLDKIIHENQIRKKQFMPTDNVFEFVTTIAGEFAAFLDPILGKIKQQLPDMDARTHDELEKTFAVGRNKLSRHIEGKTVNELIQLFNPEEDPSSTESTEDT